MTRSTSIAVAVGGERRLRDRRQAGLKGALLVGMFRGRRRGPRRDIDRHSYYVDWYDDNRLLAVVTAIFILNCMDAMFTLTLLSEGAEEVNLFMVALLDIGVPTFVNIKLTITAIALVFLVAHSNFRIVGGLCVRHLLYVILAKYIALIIYELHLLKLVV